MHIHNVYFWLKGDLEVQALGAFEDGLDALAGAAHLKFIEDHASKWERVVVYDIQTKGGWAGKLDV